MKDYDAVGIGNALIDILAHVDETYPQKFGLEKGAFNLVDEKKIAEIMGAIQNFNPKFVPAGSSANVIMGISNLGGKCNFIGRVGKDSFGEFYHQNLKRVGVDPKLAECNISLTGKCISLITPDSERTFATNLGAAGNLSKADITEDAVKKAKILHLTGYETESAREAAFHAIEIARENETKISLDLADSFLIKRRRSDIQQILASGVNFLFANEGEAQAFTGLENPSDAIEELSKFSEITVVKIGSRGSLIKSNCSTYQIPIYTTKVVDTTGAGDLYAAGFLWAQSQGKPLELCGKTGSFMASKVISQIGAIIEEPMRGHVEKLG